ncbi:troponin C, skeletal muscle-like isoform X2 [Oscarella lobularis]|uniref:troponin C, skeletal muscle-like isoform X2 n=1 Tax=Oscarella lobularis TaxID=121494 RepID=UPI003313A5A9
MAFGRAAPPLSKIIFEKYDSDRSGHVDLKELRNIVYHLGHSMNDVELVAAMRTLDKDSSGKITYDEFQAWWRQGPSRFATLQLTEEEEKKLESAISFFKYYDKDMSGELDRKEFEPVFKSLTGAGHQLGSLDDALKTLDKSEDGKISLNEYIGWLFDIGSLKK